MHVLMTAVSNQATASSSSCVSIKAWQLAAIDWRQKGQLTAGAGAARSASLCVASQFVTAPHL